MNQKTVSTNKILTIIGIVLCAILVPILIVNCTLIVKSMINKDEVPAFAGIMPMIVLSPSMEPDIKDGDLIICAKADAADVQVGDVISFFDPSGKGMMVTTHKVDEIVYEDGKTFFRTYGINNKNTDGTFDKDPKPVPAENLVGKYTGIRLPAVGSFAMFMQTPAGLILCVALPIIALIAYDLIRRKKMDKNNDDDVAALRAELEKLKRMQEVGVQNEERRAQNEESAAQNEASTEFKPLNDVENEESQSD
jgi:signal peptidase